MHYRHFLTAPGYLAQSERWQLYLLANSLPAAAPHGASDRPSATIVNIGVEHGASLTCLRQGNPSAHLIGVDLDNSKFTGQFEVALYTGDSATAGHEYKGRPVDLLFIDGDHTYAGCKADIDAWLPHMAPGALVAFHDSGAPQCEGVNRAIGEWIADAVGWVELPRAGTIRTFKNVLPVSVLIPTYKRPQIVLRTVDLLLSNLRHLGQLTIYVGDDSGDGETRAVLHGYPSTMVLDSPGRGLGANLNHLLRATPDPLIVQLDDDHHLVAPLDLTPHVDKLTREPLAGWVHLMMNAQGNEQWELSDFLLRGDDLRHWRIMPDSPCKFFASNQPHLKRATVHDYYGLYSEPAKTWQQETEFNERVQRMHREKPDTSPRFYVPVEAYGFRHWRHVGDSYAKRGM